MDDLPHSSPEEVAKRLRELAKGLTDADDIAAVNKYVDELESLARCRRIRSAEQDLYRPEAH